MRRNPLILLAGLCLLTSPLIAQPEKPVPVPKVEPAANAEAMPEAVVTLIDAGEKEGRQELRFRLVKGSTETMVMRIKMGMEQTMNGGAMPKTDLPTMVFTMAVKVEKVEKSGDASCEVEFTDMTVAEEAGVPAAVRDAMEESGKKIKGLKADVVISDRGIPRSSKMRGDVNDPEVKTLMDSMNQGMQQASAPLPKEPVGVGAKWQVVTNPKAGGFTQTLTVTYTLKSLTAEGAKFDVAIAQTAKEQDVDNPSLPAGVTARIKSVDGTGKGTAEIRFSQSSPVASSATSKTTIDMTVKAQGQEFAMKQVVSTDVKVEGKAGETKK